MGRRITYPSARSVFPACDYPSKPRSSGSVSRTLDYQGQKCAKVAQAISKFHVCRAISSAFHFIVVQSRDLFSGLWLGQLRYKILDAVTAEYFNSGNIKRVVPARWISAQPAD